MNNPKHGWNVFRPHAQGDLCRVWGTLSFEDLRELSSFGSVTPEEIEKALEMDGAQVLTWDTEDGPVAVCGVTPGEYPGSAVVWLIPGSGAHKRWRWGVRHTEEVLLSLSKDYAVLYNIKDARNTKQIAWLKRLGFTFLNQFVAENGLPYIEFSRIMK